MKHWYLVIFLLFPMVSQAQEWKLIASGLDGFVEDVYFVNKDVGWMVGRGTLILKTTDGGLSWTRQYPDSTAEYKAVWFTDENNGWVVGGRIGAGVILHTTDGGKTWIEERNDARLDPYDVQFVSKDTGWIAGGWSSFGPVLKTTNGGKEWFSQGAGIQGQYRGLSFINSTTGWIGGARSYFDNFEDAVVYRTDDGGETWKYQETNKIGPLRAIHFASDYSGVIGGRGYAFRTLDGGKTWRSTDKKEAHTLYLIDKNHLHLDSDMLYLSSNMGNSWNKVPQDSGGGITGLFFLDTLTGWAVGGIAGEWRVWKYHPAVTSYITPIPNKYNTIQPCYPNPAGNRTQNGTIVYVPYSKHGDTQIVHTTISTLLGEIVEQRVITQYDIDEGYIKYDVSNLRSGTYFMSIGSAAISKTLRIVVRN